MTAGVREAGHKMEGVKKGEEWERRGKRCVSTPTPCYPFVSYGVVS